MVEESNVRVGMMIDSLAHINMIQPNPDLDFSIAPCSAADDYTGERGMDVANWGDRRRREQRQHIVPGPSSPRLMSTDINSEPLHDGERLPGQRQPEPDFWRRADPKVEEAFTIFQAGYPDSPEFTGRPRG